MQMSPYLSFKGECEAAFELYRRCLGGRLGEIFRYAGSPMADQAPAGWQDKVMHGSVEVGGVRLMGGDVPPDRYQEPKGIVLSMQIETVAEAERVFRELADGGTVVMPFEQTFWSAGFGMLVDRFGIPWQINCDQQPTGA